MVLVTGAAPPGVVDVTPFRTAAQFRPREGCKLWCPDRGEFPASDLYKDAPCVLVIIRRPGCVLCRYQAHELQRGLKELLEGLGVGMACILHEWVPAEVEKFAKYWKGPIYLDKAMDFYKFNSKGVVKSTNVLAMLNPFGPFPARFKEAKKAAGKDANRTGSGSGRGGVCVVNKGGSGFTYLHIAKDLGQAAYVEDVLAGVKLATGTS